MSAPEIIQKLVHRFNEHADAYHAGGYNETQVRIEFLDPFFEALGWDLFNKQGYAEAYKDVIHEDAIKVGGATKAPDYAFRIGGTRKFFVEAKKPAVNVKEEVSPAYQLRRYAWSAKLPLSILSDFEELAVYDCRSKPDKTDKASTGRVQYYYYTDYIEKWDEIAAIFSREAVLKGSFDQFAETAKGKHGTAEVDDAFLVEIERWRDLLAHNLALRNQQISQRELNYAVQMTIDRIIFLRICEDRGIERYGQLLALLNGGEVYARLGQIFRKADERYNSGLFHFRDEGGQVDSPDTFTLGLTIDDKPIKDILGHLYYPDSPYEFSVLPADILGQVYEQFLGKVIRLTTGHRAVIDDKPEVKKAGGVYYTPTYIVEYIVRHTVGKLLEDKKTGSDDTPLRILDPACGSGSFLLGAFQYLLDWYRDGYVANGPEKWAKGRKTLLYQAGGGEWKLTTAERKRILIEHIYGVDIDPQAVEVTKLSLLLKVLEGESEQTLARQLSLWQERVLPDLSKNIQCGNSLIGPDFYQQLMLASSGSRPSSRTRGPSRTRGLSPLLKDSFADSSEVTAGLIYFFDDEEQYRINAFDWPRAFPLIFKDGGFDVVIGNPPYIRIQALKEWAPREVEFYKQHYTAASKGNYDIYVVFVEKGLSLLNKNGRLGFILPHKFFNAQYGQPLRELLAKGKYLTKVDHFGDQQVFEGATTYTCLIFMENCGRDTVEVEKVNDLDGWRAGRQGAKGTIAAANVTAAEWNFTVGKGMGLFERLSKMPMKLGDVADIFVGLQTSADDIFIMDLVEESQNTIRLYSKVLGEEYIFEKGLLYPLVSGTDVNRYKPLPTRQFILFPYKIENETVELVDFEVLSKNYPRTAEYLQINKKRLENREKGKIKGHRWYGYIYLKNMTRQSIKKLCIPRLVNRLYASYDCDGKHFLDNVDVGGITFKQQYYSNDLRYLLGLLNSKLLRWYFPYVSAPFRGGWLSANRQFLSQLPIHPINFSDPADAAHHDHMVALVEHMLNLHQRLATAKTPNDKTMLQRQIEATDREIDTLVYTLYGLSDEEIRVVE